MRKFGNVFPVVEVVVPELEVLELVLPLLLPPPPHPAATSATPTVKVAASSHSPRILIKSLPPGLVSLSRRRPPGA
jgi:hypothetical protein